MFGLLTKSRLALLQLSRSRLLPMERRAGVLRWLGMGGIGRAAIQDGCEFRGFETRIGDGCFINTGVHFDGGEVVELGRNVFVGPRAVFLTGTHDIAGPEMRAGQPSVHRPVSVGEGCWIGAGAIILPGVTIGAGCVIGAGSVVTKDCQPDGLYAGVPARLIRPL